MNFGFTLITIFYIVILIVPGIFFKKFYFQAKFSHEFHNGAFADKAITSIFWGLLIQLAAIFLVKVAFGLSFDELYLRANNLYSSIHKQEFPRISYKQLKYFFLFFIFSIILACACGHIFHKLIRFFKLDVIFSSLRFANEWNYIFRNEMSITRAENSERKKYLSTELDIIVKESKNEIPRFYSGILKDYFLNESGQLDKIVLGAAKKRVLNDNKENIFVDIKGDIFIVPYCNIENINLRYNYITNKRAFKIPSAIRNTIVLCFALLFFIVLILPWFLDVNFWGTFISILLLIVSWVFIFTAVLSSLEEDQENNKKLPLKNRLTIGIIGVIALVVGLDTLNVINIIKILTDLISNIGEYFSH